MCIKIICTDHEHEFNPFEPLEHQVVNAKEVVVNYDPADPTLNNIAMFVDQMERMYRKGISCTVDIRVNSNNNLNGIKLERKIGNLKAALDTNEAIKLLTKLHADTDRRLLEIAGMCLGEADER